MRSFRGSLCHQHFVAQVLKDATQFFSRGTPNLATVIPAMDFINDCLTAQTKNRSLSPAIKASLGLGKRTLNKYYSLTDSFEVYHIAMSMLSIFYCDNLLISSLPCSPPSLSQARLLQECWLGARLDRHCERPST
jgi:hypothetical protein